MPDREPIHAGGGAGKSLRHLGRRLPPMHSGLLHEEVTFDLWGREVLLEGC